MKGSVNILLLLSLSMANSDYCLLPDIIDGASANSREYYNIGDTISEEDQTYPYSVCHSDGNYETGSTVTFSDYTGYITLISMNATWWPACYDYISLMDDIIEFINENEYLKFIVSLDYAEVEPSYFTCQQWGDLYSELGEYGNDPLILNGDPDQLIWNMFAGSTYSAYVLIDHNMVLRYKFDMPNLYDFQYNYIPELLNNLYGCTDATACNYDPEAGVDDGTCEYGDTCVDCFDFTSQLDCMSEPNCMWMGDHCMESIDDCMTYQTELDCMSADGCYWMGDHCMAGDSCTDPIAYNYNPIADLLGQDDGSCEYSPYINFGCTYDTALNYSDESNVDDGSCEYDFTDLNGDGDVNILDIVFIVNAILLTP